MLCETNCLPLRIQKITAEETILLRHSVLCPDKPVSYVCLPEDDAGHHYGVFLPSTSVAVAVISVFVEPLSDCSNPVPAEQDCAPDVITAARFRKFACEPSYQGQGTGSALLKYVFGIVRSELGCGVLWCDAQMSSAEWYERRGMQKFGPVFFKGDIEYIKMKVDV